MEVRATVEMTKEELKEFILSKFPEFEGYNLVEIYSDRKGLEIHLRKSEVSKDDTGDDTEDDTQETETSDRSGLSSLTEEAVLESLEKGEKTIPEISKDLLGVTYRTGSSQYSKIYQIVSSLEIHNTVTRYETHQDINGKRCRIHVYKIRDPEEEARKERAKMEDLKKDVLEQVENGKRSQRVIYESMYNENPEEDEEAYDQVIAALKELKDEGKIRLKNNKFFLAEEIKAPDKIHEEPKIVKVKQLVLEGKTPEEAYDEVYGTDYKLRAPPVMSVLKKLYKEQKKSESDHEPAETERVRERETPETEEVTETESEREGEIPNEDVLREKVLEILESKEKVRVAEFLNRLECDRKYTYRLLTKLKEEDIICASSTKEVMLVPSDKKNQVLMFMRSNKRGAVKIKQISNYIKRDNDQTKDILEELKNQGKIEQTVYGEWKLTGQDPDEPEDEAPEEGYPEEKYEMIKNFVEIWKGKKKGFAKDELEQSSILNDDEVDIVWEHLCSKASPLTSKLEDELEVNLNMSPDGITIIVDPLFD